jgi:hypothetical protein
MTPGPASRGQRAFALFAVIVTIVATPIVILVIIMRAQEARR